MWKRNGTHVYIFNRISKDPQWDQDWHDYQEEEKKKQSLRDQQVNSTKGFNSAPKGWVPIQGSGIAPSLLPGEVTTTTGSLTLPVNPFHHYGDDSWTSGSFSFGYIPEEPVALPTCDCGTFKTMGEVDLQFHSSWCSLKGTK